MNARQRAAALERALAAKDQNEANIAKTKQIEQEKQARRAAKEAADAKVMAEIEARIAFEDAAKVTPLEAFLGLDPSSRGVGAAVAGGHSGAVAQARPGRPATQVATQAVNRRDQIVDAAVASGRIAQASRKAWRDRLDVDEAGTVETLSNLAAVPGLPGSPVLEHDQAAEDDALYRRLFG